MADRLAVGKVSWLVVSRLAGWCLGRVASLPARWRAGRARRGGDRLAGVTIARLRGPAIFPFSADLFLIHFLQISRWTWRVQPALQM